MSADCIITIDRLLMVALSGLAAWVGKVWATRISQKDNAGLEEELEKVRLDLGKRALIHKIQFEKEFEVYLDLSKRIHAFRTAYFTLNSTIHNVPADPDEAAKKQKELQAEFANSYERLRDGLEEYKPFYAKSVYEKASAIIEVGVDQLIYNQFPINSTIPRYREVQAQKSLLLKNIESVIDEIRIRISSIQVKE